MNGSDVFEMVSGIYFGHVLPRLFGHAYRTISPRQVPAGEENALLEGGTMLVGYDGRTVIENLNNFLTRTKGLGEPAQVSGIEDIVRELNKPVGNKSDKTLVYSHSENGPGGLLYRLPAHLRNSYPGIEVDSLVDRLPQDFMSPDGRVGNEHIGSGTTAALATTKKYPMGVVHAKKTEYILGGQVVDFWNGLVRQRAYATGYDPEKKALTIETVRYDAGGKEESRSQREMLFEERGRRLLPRGYTGPPLEMDHESHSSVYDFIRSKVDEAGPLQKEIRLDMDCARSLIYGRQCA